MFYESFRFCEIYETRLIVTSRGIDPTKDYFSNDIRLPSYHLRRGDDSKSLVDIPTKRGDGTFERTQQ